MAAVTDMTGMAVVVVAAAVVAMAVAKLQ